MLQGKEGFNYKVYMLGEIRQPTHTRYSPQVFTWGHAIQEVIG